MQQKLVLPPINRPLTPEDLESVLRSAQSGAAVTVSQPFVNESEHEFSLSASVVLGSNNVAKWYLFDGERSGGSMLWTTSTQHVELVLTKVQEIIKKQNSSRKSGEPKPNLVARNERSIELPAPAVFNAQAYKECMTAITEQHSGLLNEGCLFWLLGLEVERFKRHQEALSLMIITFYNQAMPVFESAQRVKSALRAIDQAFAYQNQFALILPSATAPDARICAERLSAVLQQGIAIGSPQFFSIGIATIPTHCEHPGVLIAAAQQASQEARLADKIIQVFGSA